MINIINLDVINPIGKRARIKTNILASMPNDETIPDPNWTDPGDGSKQPQILKYTDAEWFNKMVLDFFQIHNERGAEKLQKQAAEPVDDIRAD